MRATTPLRLLLPAFALIATACDDESSDPLGPADPVVAETETPAPESVTGPLEDFAYWADGYLTATMADGKFVTVPNTTFNRSGGAITVTKVAGTTGRYVARFRNLTTLLGGKSTLHVTSGNGKNGNDYCKPVGAFLVRDSVEVRCYTGGGAAKNASFSLNVLGKRDDRAFAFASQPTADNYAPASAGSWNPAGPIRVYRTGVGSYTVVFTGMGGRLTAGHGGHVQVNAVSTNKVHCMTDEWGGSPDLIISVACYAPTGARADSKFTAMFTPPAAHLAYVWADQPTLPSYTPHSGYSSNPVGGAVTVTREQVGEYVVRWTGIDGEIRDLGNAQVTAWGYDNARCKAAGYGPESVTVHCFGSNGLTMDTYFTVLLGS